MYVRAHLANINKAVGARTHVCPETIRAKISKHLTTTPTIIMAMALVLFAGPNNVCIGDCDSLASLLCRRVAT